MNEPMVLSLWLDGQEVLRFVPKPNTTIGDLQKVEDTLNGGSTRFRINAADVPCTVPLKTFEIADKEGESDVWLIGDCLASRYDELEMDLDNELAEHHRARLEKERASVERLLRLFWPRGEAIRKNRAMEPGAQDQRGELEWPEPSADLLDKGDANG